MKGPATNVQGSYGQKKILYVFIIAHSGVIKINLYELSGAYAEIQELMQEGEEDLEDTLEALEDAIEDKAIGYAKVIRNLESRAKVIREEEKRFAERRRAIENNIKRLKESLQESLEFNDIQKMTTDLFTFNIQNNPPSVKVVDEKVIPHEYLIEQQPKIDRRSLLNDLKNGKVIKGAEIHQGKSIRIR